MLPERGGMKKYISIMLMCASVAMLSGCSGNNSPETSESVPVYQESAAGITVGHAAVTAKTDVNGDPAIADNRDTYYSYMDRCWRHC